MVLICKIWTGSVSPRKCGPLTLFCVMVLPVCCYYLCFAFTCVLLLPYLYILVLPVLPVYCYYLCMVRTCLLFRPVYFGTCITCFTCVLFLPVSLGVLSTQYPTSPANNSVAPPEENPYTAGNCSELGERLMRKRPTPNDHIRSP